MLQLLAPTALLWLWANCEAAAAVSASEPCCRGKAVPQWMAHCFGCFSAGQAAHETRPMPYFAVVGLQQQLQTPRLACHLLARRPEQIRGRCVCGTSMAWTPPSSPMILHGGRQQVLRPQTRPWPSHMSTPAGAAPSCRDKYCFLLALTLVNHFEHHCDFSLKH